MRSFSRMIVMVALEACSTVVVAQTGTVVYVDDDAPSGGDGTSWSKAYASLRTAAEASTGLTPPIEIRLAGGIYYSKKWWPADEIVLRNDQHVYGGYRGLAPGGSPDDRDIGQFESVIAGEGDVPALQVQATTPTTIDGVTIDGYQTTSRTSILHAKAQELTLRDVNMTGKCETDKGLVVIQATSLVWERISVSGYSEAGAVVIAATNLSIDDAYIQASGWVHAIVMTAHAGHISGGNFHGQAGFGVGQDAVKLVFADKLDIESTNISASTHTQGGPYVALRLQTQGTVRNCKLSATGTTTSLSSPPTALHLSGPLYENCEIIGQSAGAALAGASHFEGCFINLKGTSSSYSFPTLSGESMTVGQSVINVEHFRAGAAIAAKAVEWRGCTVAGLSQGSFVQANELKVVGTGIEAVESADGLLRAETISVVNGRIVDCSNQKTPIISASRSAQLANVLIARNTVIGGGEGGVLWLPDGASLTNATIVDNVVKDAAWPLAACAGVVCAGPGVALRNCIVWGNRVAGGLHVLDQQFMQGGASVAYTCLEGFDASVGGEGNIASDPMIERRKDYVLSAGSPCIDAGDSAALPVDLFDLDQDGDLTEPLPLALGGEPRQVDDPLTPDTGAGAAPIVDIGSHEFSPEFTCIADCDQSGGLDIEDFVCFQTQFAVGMSAADCDGDGTLTVNDFVCFQVVYASGC